MLFGQRVRVARGCSVVTVAVQSGEFDYLAVPELGGGFVFVGRESRRAALVPPKRGQNAPREAPQSRNDEDDREHGGRISLGEKDQESRTIPDFSQQYCMHASDTSALISSSES